MLKVCLVFCCLVSHLSYAQDLPPAGVRLKDVMKEPIYPVGVDSVESARAALKSGAKVLFLSGSWVSASLLGKPDTGYYKLEHAEKLAKEILKEFPDALLLVDIDSGFGDTPSAKDIMGRNIGSTLKTIERLKEIGVAGVVPDDQEPVDRKPDIQKGKEVISRQEFTDMMENARKAAGDDFVIVGRTASENTEEAIERAKMLNRMSDLVIVEALNENKGALAKLKQEIPDLPLSTIQIDQGQEAVWTAADHAEIKLSMVLMPTSLRRFELEPEGDLRRFDIDSTRERLFQISAQPNFDSSCSGRMSSLFD